MQRISSYDTPTHVAYGTNRSIHMRRKFFAYLIMALLTTTACGTTPSGAGQAPSGAGQVPFGTADIPISHRDRVYTADQWSNTVTVTDPVDNKLLGVIRLGE